MRSAFAHPVTPHRRAVELPLIAEGRVEALPSDPHRIHQHLGRTTLESMLAKDVNRGVERSVRVELSGSGHARILPFRNVHSIILAEAFVPPSNSRGNGVGPAAR